MRRPRKVKQGEMRRPGWDRESRKGQGGGKARRPFQGPGRWGPSWAPRAQGQSVSRAGVWRLASVLPLP